MDMAYPIASVADLIGEPARAAMLVALLDGRALPAGELARLAGVSAQSASRHLSKMADGGLLGVRKTGRHRYYAIASPDVGHAIEALGLIARQPSRSTLALSSEATAVRIARSCYDHLAGRVAIELTDYLEKTSILRTEGAREYKVERDGEAWFLALGIDVDALRRSRRAFALQCMDWTERRPHVAGALGAALLSRLISLGWLARRSGTRALRITHQGELQLQARFGIGLSRRHATANSEPRKAEERC
jgi:DNA-binding transcriptional ArsR family regulator